MSYTFDIRGESLTVRIAGDIDHHTASDVRSQTDNAIFQGGIKRVIFDFNKVSFMDSSGIGLLMGRYKLMQAIGGNVCVFGAGENISRILDMSGMDKIINFYNNEEEAFFSSGEGTNDEKSYKDTVFE